MGVVPKNLRARIELALVLAVVGWTLLRTFNMMRLGWGHSADDAYITLRYARNLAEGHGIVWNTNGSVPVEGYSNFPFVLLGAAAFKVGLDPIVVLKSVSCLSLGATCLLLYFLTRRFLSPLASTLPALLLTAYWGTVFWAISGLETAVFQLTFVAATTAYVIGLDAPAATVGRWQWSRSRWHLLAGLCSFFAGVTRPEGPVIAVVLCFTTLVDSGVQWLRTKDDAARADIRRAFLVTVKAFAIGFLAPYALYFAWRVVHFERLLPNTVYCKSHMNYWVGTNPPVSPWELVLQFWQGQDHGRDCPRFRPCGAEPLVLLALVQDPRKLSARLLPLVLMPLVYVGILHRADPIIGDHSRHFLAALALLVVASSMGLANLAGVVRFLVGRVVAALGKPKPVTDEGETSPRSIWALACDVALLLGSLTWLATPLPVALTHLEEEARTYPLRMHAREELGRYLDRALSPDQTYVIGDTGMVPFMSHANVIDAYCLNTREETLPPVSYDVGRFVDWVYERAPDLLIVHSDNNKVLRPKDYYGFYPALVRDKRFRERYQERKPSRFGAAGDDFSYWIFERKPAAAPP
jgi:hypothetical protein